MPDLWVIKIKLKINGATLNDVPPRYYDEVKRKLDEQGIPYQ